MMIFKELHIDYDSMSMDGNKIYRPEYISPSAWVDFWEFSGSEYRDNQLKQAYDEGARDCESEHEKEIDKLKWSFAESLNRLLIAVKLNFSDNSISKDDQIEYIVSRFNEEIRNVVD